MTDFRLFPAPRTPGSGRDFRLYPGGGGSTATGIAVGGTAMAPAGIASGTITTLFIVAVGGTAQAPAGVALGAVAIRRFITVTARVPWGNTETKATLARLSWADMTPLTPLMRSRWASLASVSPLVRARWPGLPHLEKRNRVRWGEIAALPSPPVRARWPGLLRREVLSRVRWGDLPALPSAPVRARWPTLQTQFRIVRSPWLSLNSAPSAPVRATWRDLLTPWIRERIRWGRLITPPWVWPRPPLLPWRPPPIPPHIADTFRLYLRRNPTVRDFRLRLGGPFLVTTRRSLLMQPTCILYRLSDNLPLEGVTLNLRADRDSYGWAATLTTPSEATLDALFASDPPESFVAVVNGHTWHIQPQTWRQTVSFGELGYAVTCNSRTALLGIEATTGTVATSMTARQIAEAALEGTGFALQWDCPVDPTLPAGRVTWRDATPKMRVRAISEALGATLQSARAADTLIVTPRRILAPWELAGNIPEVVLEGALIASAELGLAEPALEDCVFVSGTESGYLVKVTRTGAAGERPAAAVTDPYLTEILACRERGRQVLAAAANRKSLSVETILNTLGSPPGVLAPGTLVELVVGTARWLDEVMSCSIDVKFGKVTQTLGFGEGHGNEFVRLQKLLPTDPLLVGTVIAVWPDGTSTVELPGGGELRVSGDSVAIGARVYVRGGKIQGEAPALTGASVEV
jgi:hypothetical protein